MKRDEVYQINLKIWDTLKKELLKKYPLEELDKIRVHESLLILEDFPKDKLEKFYLDLSEEFKKIGIEIGEEIVAYIRIF